MTTNHPVPAYAVALLTRVDVGPDVLRYMTAIDATLEPFGGRFLVHGAEATPLEGPLPGQLVVIAFPDRERAAAWYASAAYAEILPLRLRHAEGWVILVDGVPEGYRAATTAARLAAAVA